MSEEITQTDLAQEVPTGRAVVHQSLMKAEIVKVEVKMPGWLGGTTIKLDAEVHADSTQSAGLATLMLIGACCLLAGIASVLGVSALTAVIIGLCVSIGTYTLIQVINFLSRRQAR